MHVSNTNMVEEVRGSLRGKTVIKVCLVEKKRVGEGRRKGKITCKVPVSVQWCPETAKQRKMQNENEKVCVAVCMVRECRNEIGMSPI